MSDGKFTVIWPGNLLEKLQPIEKFRKGMKCAGYTENQCTLSIRGYNFRTAGVY